MLELSRTACIFMLVVTDSCRFAETKRRDDRVKNRLLATKLSPRRSNDHIWVQRIRLTRRERVQLWLPHCNEEAWDDHEQAAHERNEDKPLGHSPVGWRCRRRPHPCDRSSSPPPLWSEGLLSNGYIGECRWIYQAAAIGDCGQMYHVRVTSLKEVAVAFPSTPPREDVDIPITIHIPSIKCMPTIFNGTRSLFLFAVSMWIKIQSVLSDFENDTIIIWSFSLHCGWWNVSINAWQLIESKVSRQVCQVPVLSQVTVVSYGY